jgi:hypothetical protein
MRTLNTRFIHLINPIMKKLIFTFTLILASVAVFAQGKNDENPKHTNFYKNPEQIKTSDVTVSFDNIVSKKDFVKLKIKITNNTSDYIIFKPAECVFVYEAGEFKPVSNSLKVWNKDNLIIKPNDNATTVIETKGGTNFHKDAFSMKLNGFYKVPANGEVQTCPNFQLPASTNNFEPGNFKCIMTGISKETQQTQVRFSCTYNGEDIGIIEPSKPVIKIEKGQEFANTYAKAKPAILAKGEDDKFTLYFEVPASVVDMQFATMWIVWKNTFMESIPKALTIPNVNFSVDAGMTDAKNK